MLSNTIPTENLLGAPLGHTLITLLYLEIIYAKLGTITITNYRNTNSTQWCTTSSIPHDETSPSIQLTKHKEQEENS